MRWYVTLVLVALLLVPLLAWAAPTGSEARLPVLAPVTVSGYTGDPGHGLDKVPGQGAKRLVGDAVPKRVL
jgi:hypothetical protein